MVTVEQQFRLEIPPPRLNLTKACNAFLKSVAPHISVGYAAMDYEINRQMLLEAPRSSLPGDPSIIIMESVGCTRIDRTEANKYALFVWGSLNVVGKAVS